MDRRPRLVALTTLVAVSLVVAGCTATLDSGESGTPTMTPVTPPTGSPPGTATGGPLGSPSATPGECVAVEQATVDPFREDVQPRDLPDPPAVWNRSSVERYVVAFEEAWAYNAALEVASRDVSVIVGDVSVTRRDGVWVVELTSRTNTWVQSSPSGERTATVVHGDGAPIPVTYRLTDRALYRTEGRIGGTPSSSATTRVEPSSGSIVACFDG